jgi:hypothetical protein
MSNHQPIFSSIFGKAWEKLPAVFLKHYANRPFSDDVVVVEGTMAVEMSWLASLFAPLLRLSGALVPIAGRDIPVTVTFRSEADSQAFCFDREFRFPGREPYHFRSTMVPMGGDEVIEWMPIGLGWRAAFSWADEQVHLTHRGYAVRLFGRVFPLPLDFLLGRGEAYEEAIDDSTFRMAMTIRHAWFGKVYGYSGTFRIREMRLDG